MAGLFGVDTALRPKTRVRPELLAGGVILAVLGVVTAVVSR